MGLDTSFWTDPTDPITRVEPGQLFLEVGFDSSVVTWPEIWTPGAVWGNPGLTMIGVNVMDATRKCFRVINVMTGGPWYRVDGRFNYIAFGKQDTIDTLPCVEGTQYTLPDVDDIWWLFDHWRPGLPYSLDTWWGDLKGRASRIINVEGIHDIESALDRCWNQINF